jgi:hypothetical protein|tara:strand:+ start:7142 stop:7375 length:234 start_codon:yes stop_codon:yes gene_type:complete
MDQGMINTVITLGAGIFGWIMKTLWDSVRKLEANVSEIEVRVAGDYVKRGEYRQDIQRIFEKLDVIEAKIDSKADKK